MSKHINERCNINESEICFKCLYRICRSVPLIEHLLSGDERKIKKLTEVMNKYELKIEDYI